MRIPEEKDALTASEPMLALSRPLETIPPLSAANIDRLAKHQVPVLLMESSFQTDFESGQSVSIETASNPVVTDNFSLPIETIAADLNAGHATPNNFGLNTGFDLDLLDWSMLDSAFFPELDEHASTSESSNQYAISPEPTRDAPPCTGFHSQDEHDAPLPAAMSLMQISPLEAHQADILKCLRRTHQCTNEREQWLSLGNMSMFLKSYFAFFHQHTPLLHLPSWSTATTSTRLLFAMLLMGAMYSGDLKHHGKESRDLCQIAQTFAWESDPGFESGNSVQLDTIQAIYLLALLDSFYFPSQRYRSNFDTARLINAARKAGIFETSNAAEMTWDAWSNRECRIR
jgi:hypothetical protein